VTFVVLVAQWSSFPFSPTVEFDNRDNAPVVVLTMVRGEIVWQV